MKFGVEFKKWNKTVNITKRNRFTDKENNLVVTSEGRGGERGIRRAGEDSLQSHRLAHQAPLSMGILQIRILEWAAMPSSRGSSQPKDWTQVSHTAGGFFTKPLGKPKKYEVLSIKKSYKDILYNTGI